MDYPFGANANMDSASLPPNFRAGVLDIHGATRTPTWTRLDATAAVGTHVIVLSDAVDWQPGEHLVIASSEMDISQNEEVVIAAVLGPRTLQLTQPLLYSHRSQVFEFEGRRVDLRPEVGLLTHNVVIQGDAASDAQLFGVHTMAMMSGLYRISGTEVRNCGQSGVLGRYCTHFHMVGTRPDAYLRGNAVHRSYQRVVSVHASNEVVVADNVGYDIRAHAFFVEDGASMVGGVGARCSCLFAGGPSTSLGSRALASACNLPCVRTANHSVRWGALVCRV